MGQMYLVSQPLTTSTSPKPRRYASRFAKRLGQKGPESPADLMETWEIEAQRLLLLEGKHL